MQAHIILVVHFINKLVIIVRRIGSRRDHITRMYIGDNGRTRTRVKCRHLRCHNTLVHLHHYCLQRAYITVSHSVFKILVGGDNTLLTHSQKNILITHISALKTVYQYLTRKVKIDLCKLVNGKYILAQTALYARIVALHYLRHMQGIGIYHGRIHIHRAVGILAAAVHTVELCVAQCPFQRIHSHFLHIYIYSKEDIVARHGCYSLVLNGIYAAAEAVHLNVLYAVRTVEFKLEAFFNAVLADNIGLCIAVLLIGCKFALGYLARVAKKMRHKLTLRITAQGRNIYINTGVYILMFLYLGNYIFADIRCHHYRHIL